MSAFAMLVALLLPIVIGSIVANSDVSLPLQTQSRFIVDQTNKVVQLGCVNWYGAHMEAFVVNGLDAQKVDTITTNIVSLGFNCVRLPYSTELLIANPVITNTSTLAANLELLGKDAITILDTVITSLTSRGLFVILNNHIGKAQWCCSDTDGEGLWYSDSYSTADFETSWQYLAHKYSSNKYVIGADLRNELRSNGKVSPTWGTGNVATDWALEATIVGNQLLSIAPDWLIIVEGLSYSTNMRDVQRAPIQLNIPNRLVYSPHDYSWSQPSMQSYSQLRTYLDSMWGYLLTENQTYTAPLWIGEFGTDTSDNWWAWFRQYIQERQLSWSYWALDGEKYVGVDETFGLYLKDYETIRHPWKVADLQALMSSAQKATK